MRCGVRSAILCAAVLASTAAAETTAFINVNVVTMQDEHISAAQTVLVEDGLIRRIGPVDSTPVTEGSIVVDGTDRYLMPGLAEMHAHIPHAQAAELGRVMTLFVANGVTTVRGMLGHPSQLALRAALAGGEDFGPRLVTAGPSLNGQSVRGAADAAAAGQRRNMRQATTSSRFIPASTASEFAAIAAAADELGMPFAGHVPVAVGVESALAAGMATIDHLDGYLAALMPANSDTSGGYGGFFDVHAGRPVAGRSHRRAGARTAASGTWNVPTEALFEHRVAAESAAELSRRPEMRYVTAATLQALGARQAAAGKRARLRRDARGRGDPDSTPADPGAARCGRWPAAGLGRTTGIQCARFFAAR